MSGQTLPPAVELLAHLSRAGVKLSAKGERLIFDAPAGVVTPDVLATLQAHKGELLAVLAGDWQGAAAALLATVGDDEARAGLRHRFDERAGVCEDNGMSRPDAERAAYHEISAALPGELDAAWRRRLDADLAALRPYRTAAGKTVWIRPDVAEMFYDTQTPATAGKDDRL